MHNDLIQFSWMRNKKHSLVDELSNFTLKQMQQIHFYSNHAFMINQLR